MQGSKEGESYYVQARDVVKKKDSEKKYEAKRGSYNVAKDS